jgi:hypothetical protein
VFRFLRSIRKAGSVAKVQARPGSKAQVFQIDYATWFARLAGN